MTDEKHVPTSDNPVADEEGKFIRAYPAAVSDGRWEEVARLLSAKCRSLEKRATAANTALTALQAENERLRNWQDHNANEVPRLQMRLDAANARAEKAEAERDRAQAEAVAAYDRAAALAQAKHEVALKWASVHIPGFDGNTDSLLIANEIRALATEPGTTALAEMLDAETRACADTVAKLRDDDNKVDEAIARYAIIGRIAQRKEGV